jgi:hypothetical protein
MGSAPAPPPPPAHRTLHQFPMCCCTCSANVHACSLLPTISVLQKPRRPLRLPRPVAHRPPRPPPHVCPRGGPLNVPCGWIQKSQTPRVTEGAK